MRVPALPSCGDTNVPLVLKVEMYLRASGAGGVPREPHSQLPGPPRRARGEAGGPGPAAAGWSELLPAVLRRAAIGGL